MKNNNLKTTTKGIALAIAAAGVLAGCQYNSAKTTTASAGSSTDLVHCSGVNKCGGHNDCKTASNACKGHASCKGQGFIAMPAKACDDIGGKKG